MTRFAVGKGYDIVGGAKLEDGVVCRPAAEVVNNVNPCEPKLTPTPGRDNSATGPVESEHPSHETLAAVLENISDGFIAVDGDWRITYINNSSRKTVGETEVVGMSLWQVYPELSGTLEGYRKAARERVAVEFENYYKPWNRWFEIRVYPSTGKGLSIFFRDITERKRGAEQLRDLKLAMETQIADLRNLQNLNRLNEERFRMAAGGEGITLYEQDADLRYTWLYPLPAEHSGTLGRSDSEIFKGPEGESLENWKREVMRAGTSQRREVTAPIANGARTFDISIVARRDHTGRIIGVAGASLDVTDRNRALNASRQLAAIVESSEDAIISENLQGTITSWNKAAERIFGYAAEDVLGKSTAMLIPAEHGAEQTDWMDKVVNGDRVGNYETIRQRKDGALINVSISVSPLRNEAHQIVGVSKILRDISDRKRREEQERAIYELAMRVNRAAAMSEIFDAALPAIMRSQLADRVAVLIYDNEGKMRFRGARGLSQEYQRAVEGHSPWKGHEPDPKPVCIDDVAVAPLDEHLRAAFQKEGIRALAFIPITYEGQLLGKFVIYYNAPHPFTPAETRPVETMATQVAFAIQRQMAEQKLEQLVDERTISLREAVQQMEEFSYTISHDLRAPLRAMQVYSEALLEDYSAGMPPEGVRYLKRVAENATRLDKMILDVLSFSRIARGNHTMERVALDKLVREIVQHYPEMQPPSAELNIAPLADVVGHEPSLTQVISNLLGNAVKFVAPGVKPQVKVWTENGGPDVRLFVEDNGIGIPQKYMHLLFNMFERMHPDLPYEGTGVGLAIVRKAVERMGGQFGVESKPGAGSKFWIKLPATNTIK